MPWGRWLLSFTLNGSSSPLIADNSLGYLLRHFFELKQLTLLMIVVGGLIAFWMGKDAMLPGAVRGTNPPPSLARGNRSGDGRGFQRDRMKASFGTEPG